MNEHAVWLGDAYEQGLSSRPGEKVAIVGYSHYTDESDHVRLTLDTVRAVTKGEQHHAFFTQIASSFGESDLQKFYSAVMFFNFLPRSIGKNTEKFDTGSDTEIQAAKARFLRLLETYKPDRVFVFTTKGWENFPESDSEADGPCRPLGVEFPPRFNWDTYTRFGHVTTVIGLRHTLGSEGALLRAAVQAGLKVNRA